ncbi:MAG: class I SAM-dependent methyltransferase [Gemmatimonadales bacterium]
MIGLPGAEQSLDPALTLAERFYVRCLGVPVNGLRIRLRRVLPATNGSYRRILDAGCGPGVFTMELAKRHPQAEVLGIDIDKIAIDRAEMIAAKAGIRNCRFSTGDVTALGFREQFDLVVSVDNLEHIQDDVTALRNLNNALAPGGLLVLHTPGYYRRWPVFRRRVNFNVPGHVRPGYLTEELAGKLTAAGFDVRTMASTYGMLETVTNNVSYCITGAERKHKVLYAAVLPLLLSISYLGKFSRPEWGAGILATASKGTPLTVHAVHGTL